MDDEKCQQMDDIKVIDDYIEHTHSHSPDISFRGSISLRGVPRALVDSFRKRSLAHEELVPSTPIATPLMSRQNTTTVATVHHLKGDALRLSWRGIDVSTVDLSKSILQENTGSVQSRLLAIMGPSGCGKTTLLNYLARRPARVKTLKGTSKLNGQEYSHTELKRFAGYVMQTDLVNGKLTVQETLTYLSHLRLPPNATDEQKNARIDDVLAKVGLSHVRNTLVGDPLNKGISGGERKRLCIAMELLTKPKLLFLDEPTAGLDSVTALSVCQVLKSLTVSGDCTVIMSISQPQAKIFALFDDLMLLCKGHLVYYGPAIKANDVFSSIGHPCPPFTNIADHLIDVLMVNNIDERMILPVGEPVGNEVPPLPSNLSQQSWFSQFLVLSQRSWKEVTRNRNQLLIQLAQSMIMAILIGFAYFQIGTTQKSTVLRNPILFFCVVNQGVFGALMMINSFPSERILVIRERSAGTYYVSAYFLSKQLVESIPQIITAFLFSIVVYWLVGLQPNAGKFFLFALFMVLTALGAISLSLMVSCLCRTSTLSVTVLPTVLEITRLYAGFFLSPANLPGYFVWLDALSYCKYSYVGIALNELSGLKLSCKPNEYASDGTCPLTSGEQTIKTLGLDKYTIGSCIGVLILYIFVTRFIAYLSLRFLK